MKTYFNVHHVKKYFANGDNVGRFSTKENEEVPSDEESEYECTKCAENHGLFISDETLLAYILENKLNRWDIENEIKQETRKRKRE